MTSTSEPSSGQDISAPRPLVKRYAGVVRLAHWLNAVFLVGMIASGLQIYNAYAHFGIRGDLLPVPNPLDGHSMPNWARLGGWLAGGLNWHFLLAWPFVITGLVYLAFLAISGEWRSLVFRPSDIGPAIQMQLYYLRLRKDHPRQGKHNALQKGAYTFIVALGAISALSGFAIYKPVQLRRIRAGAVLALRGGMAVRGFYATARDSRVPGGSGVAPGHDHRLVPGKVSQP